MIAASAVLTVTAPASRADPAPGITALDAPAAMAAVGRVDARVAPPSSVSSGGWVSDLGAVDVLVPRDLSADPARVVAPWGGIEVRALGAGPVPGPRTEAAAAVASSGPGSVVVVRATSAGLQALSVSATPATTSFRYAVGLPAEVRPVPRRDGGFDLVRHAGGTSVTVARIRAPWARDAAGHRVRTWYEWTDGVLTQRLLLRPTTSYPVVADPEWEVGWCWGCLRGGELWVEPGRTATRTLYRNWSNGGWVGVATVVVRQCVRLANPWAAGACGAIGALSGALVYREVRAAALAGRCVRFGVALLGDVGRPVVRVTGDRGPGCRP